MSKYDEDKVIYVEKGTFGSSNNPVIYVRGKDLIQDKYFYVNNPNATELKDTFLDFLAELENLSRLGNEIKFDGFLNKKE